MASKAAEAAHNKFREQFEKSFGSGTLVKAAKVAPYEVIPTGSLLLDYALGVGGWVIGRLAELWGPESGGKTSLCLVSMGEAQRAYPDRRVAFIDMEQTFDTALAVNYGVDLERCDVFNPGSAEEVADAMKMLLQSGFYSMIVLDSIGAMIPEAEKEKDADEAVVALQAKIVTRMVKIAAVEAKKARSVVLIINQVRANVGGYGADTTTGGGWALKHVTTHKVKVRRTGTPPYVIKKDGEDHLVGQEIALTVEKNKVAPPKKVAVINLMIADSDRYGPKGIDKSVEAVTLGVRLGIIKQAGPYYTTPDGERYQGREPLTAALRKNPDLVESIRANAVASLAGEVIVHPEDDEEDLDG